MQLESMFLCLQIYAIVKHRGTPVVTTSGLRVEANTRRFEVDKKKELYYRTEVQNRVYKRELIEVSSCRPTVVSFLM